MKGSAMDDNKSNNPLALSPAEEEQVWLAFLDMEEAGRKTQQGPDHQEIYITLAADFLTSDVIVKRIVEDRTICGPC